MSWKDSFVAVDTETSGFSKSARVLEVSFVRYEREVDMVRQGWFVAETFSALLHPGPDFDWNSEEAQGALKVNGLTPLMFAGAPLAADILSKIPESITKAGAWVMHNSEFDMRMLAQEFDRMKANLVCPKIILCTQKLDAFFTPEGKGFKLFECAKRHDLAFDGEAHRAETDARMCGRILLKHIDKLPQEESLILHAMQDAEKAWAVRWGKDGYDHKPRPETKPAEAKEGEHHCHAHGCKTACKPEFLMCPPHWRKVPKPIADAVWQAYRPGQCDDKSPSIAWQVAADMAILAVARAEKKGPRVIAMLEMRLENTERAETEAWLRGKGIQETLNSIDPDPKPMSPYGLVCLYRDGFKDGTRFVRFREDRVRFSAYRRGYKDGLRAQSEAIGAFAQEVGYERTILRGASPGKAVVSREGNVEWGVETLPEAPEKVAPPPPRALPAYIENAMAEADPDVAVAAMEEQL
jgi:DNA polymerase III epsilon subunit-like protein